MSARLQNRVETLIELQRVLNHDGLFWILTRWGDMSASKIAYPEFQSNTTEHLLIMEGFKPRATLSHDTEAVSPPGCHLPAMGQQTWQCTEGRQPHGRTTLAVGPTGLDHGARIPVVPPTGWMK